MSWKCIGNVSSGEKIYVDEKGYFMSWEKIGELKNGNGVYINETGEYNIENYKFLIDPTDEELTEILGSKELMAKSNPPGEREKSHRKIWTRGI